MHNLQSGLHSPPWPPKRLPQKPALLCPPKDDRPAQMELLDFDSDEPLAGGCAVQDGPCESCQ